MHKKIESELVSLAHSILQMKNKEDVLALKEKAGELYEKLSVLAFVDRYVEATPSASKEDILEKAAAIELLANAESIVSDLEEPTVFKEILEEPVKEVAEEKIVEEIVVEEKVVVEIKEEIIIEEKVSETLVDEVIQEEKEIEVPALEDLFSVRKEEKINETSPKNTLEKELEGTISLDITTDIFENAVRVETPKKSLNDVLIRSNLQIDLNDRIAFVKHLFDGSQGDFNRVVSQLNSFKAEKEAVKFVMEMVKSDNDWNGKEEYEERFITLITRKFA